MSTVGSAVGPSRIVTTDRILLGFTSVFLFSHAVAYYVSMHTDSLFESIVINQVTDNFGGTGNGPMGVLGGIGNHAMDPAEARPPMRGLGAADFSSEETNHIDPSGNAAREPRPASYPQLRRVSSAFPDVAPRDPEQLVTPPETAPLRGIFSGESILPLPHAVWGLPDRPSASPNGALFDFLAGLTWRNPAELPPDDDPRGFDREERAQPGFIQRQR